MRSLAVQGLQAAETSSDSKRRHAHGKRPVSFKIEPAGVSGSAVFEMRAFMAATMPSEDNGLWMMAARAAISAACAAKYAPLPGRMKSRDLKALRSCESQPCCAFMALATSSSVGVATTVPADVFGFLAARNDPVSQVLWEPLPRLSFSRIGSKLAMFSSILRHGSSLINRFMSSLL